MAFFDWNGDGKKDFTDDFIEYNIYKNTMNHSNNYRKSGSVSSAKGFWIVFLLCCVVACFNELLAAIILVIYGLLTLMS